MGTIDKEGLYSDILQVTQLPARIGIRSPIFVPLTEWGQGVKDRLMNQRALRRPRNIELVEGDPIEDTDRSHVNIKAFPNEQMLLAQIRAVDGIDYSNQSIEQHWRPQCSLSDSPECSRDSTTSTSSKTNASTSSSPELPETSSSLVGDSTFSCNTTTTSNNSIIHNEIRDSSNSEKSKMNSLDKILSNCRYARNALIIGLIKNNLISLQDLGLQTPKTVDVEDSSYNNETESLPNEHRVSNSDRASGFVFDDRYLKYQDESDNDPNFDDIPYYDEQTNIENNSKPVKSRMILTPHSDDLDFYTNPLQVNDKVDDPCIDFTVDRDRKKDKVTLRQYVINDALDHSVFAFERKKPDMAKSNSKKIKPNSRSPAETVRASMPTELDISPHFYRQYGVNNNQFVLPGNNFPSL